MTKRRSEALGPPASRRHTAWIYAGTVLALLLAAWLVPGLV